MGWSSNLLKLLTQHNCIYLGTSQSGGSRIGQFERPNRTIVEDVWAKLTNSGLSDDFWCFAAEDTMFKQHHILHRSIGTTPYYVWFKSIPEYSDMLVFGSHIHVVNTNVTRQKLDPRMFLGFYLQFASWQQKNFNPHNALNQIWSTMDRDHCLQYSSQKNFCST